MWVAELSRRAIRHRPSGYGEVFAVNLTQAVCFNENTPL
jgi:hypothetical protein